MNKHKFTYNNFIYFSLDFYRASNKLNTMKHKLLVLLLVFSGYFGFSQQEAQYTNFMFSQMAYNPGYAGSEDKICFTILGRQQWMGFESTVDKVNAAPQTIFLTGHMPINKIFSGVGFSIIKDKIGFEDNIGLRLAYAFRLNVGPGKLGLGLQGGFLNKKIDFTKYKPNDSHDPLLLGGKESAMSFDLAFGAHFKIPDKLYVGFSSVRLTQSTSNFQTATLGTPQQKRHYFLYGGYFYQLPNNPGIQINPNLMVKTDFASAQYDFNVLGILNDKIYAGLSYRVTDAVALLAGMQFMEGGKGGISYDITTSALGYGKGRSGGTVEVWFNYCFVIIIEPEPSRHGTVFFL